MRHGSRMLAQPTIQGKAFYGIGIAMGMSILGGLSLQLGEIALGNDPLEIWDSNDPKVAMDFFLDQSLRVVDFQLWEMFLQLVLIHLDEMLEIC